MFEKLKFKKKKKVSEIDFGPTLPSDNLVPTFDGFSKKFEKDGLDPYQDEIQRIKGLNVDDFNYDRRDALIDSESRLEESFQRIALEEQLMSFENIFGQKFAELLLIFEKEDRLLVEKEFLEEKLNDLVRKHDEWRKKGSVHL